MKSETRRFVMRWTQRILAVALLLPILYLIHRVSRAGVLLAANVFAFPQWVSQEALRLLINKLVVASVFNTDWQKEYEQEFPIGATTSIKLPQAWTVRDGLNFTPQSINRLTTTATINYVKGVDTQYDDLEKMLQMERSREEISEQYLDPAMAQLAQTIDSDAAIFACLWANNIVGVLGTDPTTSTTLMQARQRLIDLACPAGGDKLMLIPPQFNTSLVPQFQAIFNPTSEISRQYKEGSIGKAWGFDWFETVSTPRQTAGTWASTMTVNGAGQSGTSLSVTGTAGDTFNQGDVFSIANVNQVNPRTRSFQEAIAKDFVVTAPLTLIGGGNAADVVQIAPAIFGPGSQYQNVDSLPANAAALTLFPGTTSPNGKSGAQGLAIHRNAFAMVSGKFETPKAVEMSSNTKDPQTGISIRYVRAWDPIGSRNILRWDVAYGFGVLYGDSCAVRVLGA